MAEASYDCIVVGSGPGGYVAAIRSAQLGKRTAVVERDKVGGRCLNYACIPAKALLRSADVLDEVRESEQFGINVSGVQVDYAAVQARREKVVTTLTSGVQNLFKKHSIDLIQGSGTLTADGAVSVDGDSYAAAPPDSTRSSVYHLCKLDTLQSSLFEASGKPQPKMS